MSAFIQIKDREDISTSEIKRIKACHHGARGKGGYGYVVAFSRLPNESMEMLVSTLLPHSSQYQEHMDLEESQPS
jgi:hypothetical protein